MNPEMWKISSETQELIKVIKKQISQYKEYNNDSVGLLERSSERIAHEKIYSCGSVDSLEAVIKYIEGWTSESR